MLSNTVKILPAILGYNAEALMNGTFIYTGVVHVVGDITRFKMADKSFRIFETDKDVATKACQFVIEKANDAIQSRGVFTIGVSGGSVAKFLANGLPSLTTDWSKWRVFFCDERHVAFDDPECTYTIYKNGLMAKVGLRDEHVFPDDPSISVEEAATKYEGQLRSVFGDQLPQFDLLLLGMGPDGHTCSLFPGHPLVQEKSKWVAAISDSPKPPPQRITLTLPVLNNARCAAFISCGGSKAEMIQRVHEGKEDPPLPASLVQPQPGQLVWFMDKPAARLLKNANL